MPTPFIEKTKAVLQDRRVQLAGGGALVALAIGALTMGGLAVAAGKPDPARPELADRARLAVEVQNRQPVPVTPSGKLATLDPSQIERVNNPAQPMDPGLADVLQQERRERAAALAEQRAFDAQMKRDMDDALRPTPVSPPEPPRQQGGWTSNSSEPGDGPSPAAEPGV